jgi:hypothetical protein
MMADAALSIVEPTKLCTRCLQRLPRSAFYPVRTGGIRSKCKACESKHQNDLYADQSGCCGWTGVALSLEEMGKPWSVSLDRLDCDRGYVKGNVMLTCRAANLARNNSTPAEMEAFVKMIKEACHG